MASLSGTQDTKLQALLGLLLRFHSLNFPNAFSTRTIVMHFSPSAVCLTSSWFLTAVGLLQHSTLYMSHSPANSLNSPHHTATVPYNIFFHLYGSL